MPAIKYNQAEIFHNASYDSDTLYIKIQNPLHCPIRVKFFSEYLKNQNIINDTLRILIHDKSEYEIKFFIQNLDTKKFAYTYFYALGDKNKKITKIPLALPFPKGKIYKIIQGNKGSFSHNTNYSKYAVDIDLKVGDTITSANDGFVVGVVKDYEFGKNDKKWQDFANFITIYHPQNGFFTQYVHLKKHGSLVKVGDYVKRGQPIGLSGATGYLDGEHLHFNVLVPEKNETLISIPFYFEGKIYSEALLRNQKIRHNR
ncbi:M23 family metallopeptidase [Chryseobacterium echinoideorum]|uniref:M23 family metallopeptidase n=1 Tax=Chryseobacterium echinoideorum TaxID=1549648 RepID=UPI001184B01A|nr:M23 family metallopeptidase [Chryseobacterium echinoideorum]